MSKTFAGCPKPVRLTAGPFAFLAVLLAVATLTAAAQDSKGADQRLNQVSWQALPLDYAIKTTRGSGKRKIAIFADPNCDYCQAFEVELAKIDDITIFVLPYPVVRRESVRQVKNIWCSKDRAQAWHDFLLRRIVPADRPPCNDPIDKIVAFGAKLGIDGTPTWFLENGQRYGGVKRSEELRQMMDAAATQKP